MRNKSFNLKGWTRGKVRLCWRTGEWPEVDALIRDGLAVHRLPPGPSGRRENLWKVTQVKSGLATCLPVGKRASALFIAELYLACGIDWINHPDKWSECEQDLLRQVERFAANEPLEP